MDIQQRIIDTETKVFKTIFANKTNHYDTLFGGEAMSLMNEVAFMTATRFTKKVCVTASSGHIDFNMPISSGTIIEVNGKVSKIGNTSLDVIVEIFIEEMYSLKRTKAISGTFTLVTLDKNNKPTKVLSDS